MLQIYKLFLLFATPVTQNFNKKGYFVFFSIKHLLVNNKHAYFALFI